MCLHEIINDHKRKSGIGYKVYLEGGGKLYGEFYDSTGEFRNSQRFLGKPFIEGKWMKAKAEAIKTMQLKYKHKVNGELIYKEYMSGFHIYKYKVDAKKDVKGWGNGWVTFKGNGNHVIRKVQYRKALISGLQFLTKIIVAGEMKILNQEEK